MPVLAALDECLAALTHTSIYADLGLEDPAMQKNALFAIHQRCNEIDETLQGILRWLDG